MSGDVISIETPEEREAFELLLRRQRDNAPVNSERWQHIQRMVEAVRHCQSTSLSGICAALYDEGCRLPDNPEAA